MFVSQERMHKIHLSSSPQQKTLSSQQKKTANVPVHICQVFMLFHPRPATCSLAQLPRLGPPGSLPCPRSLNSRLNGETCLRMPFNQRILMCYPQAIIVIALIISSMRQPWTHPGLLRCSMMNEIRGRAVFLWKFVCLPERKAERRVVTSQRKCFPKSVFS